MSEKVVDDLCNALQTADVRVVLQLPCGKIEPLLYMLTQKFFNIPLTREEEGVGIAAGTMLAGARPIMVVQSSGLGNMVNALMSLTKYYELPLPILISHRGIYKEKIAAQVPMGSHLTRVLDALDIEYKSYNDTSELSTILPELKSTYNENKVKCLLFSPKINEEISRITLPYPITNNKFSEQKENKEVVQEEIIEDIKSPLSRIDALSELERFLRNKAVISNMGYPSRELYSVFDQKSNFYMLGSLGLASSIGLGVSLFTQNEVVVLDGDGSLLMNPNALFSIGAFQPQNLTIICLDNGSYGSTGDQPTLSASGFRLEALARVSGFNNIYVTDNPGNINDFIGPGPNFVKLCIKPGNAKVGIIDIPPVDLKVRFSDWLRG